MRPVKTKLAKLQALTGDLLGITNFAIRTGTGPYSKF